jgi:hypothetical protein
MLMAFLVRVRHVNGAEGARRFGGLLFAVEAAEVEVAPANLRLCAPSLAPLLEADAAIARGSARLLDVLCVLGPGRRAEIR